MKNYEATIDNIGYILHDVAGYFSENANQKETVDRINKMLDLTDKAYVLVEWPKSQIIIDTAIKQKWNGECIINENGDSGSYFVPLKRMMEF